MSAVLFDTLKMVETLQAGGFTDQQARAMTTALGDAATVAAVATRGDVMDLGIGIKHDFDTFKAGIRRDFDALKAGVKADIAASEQRMTIRLGGMMVVMTGVLAGLHFFH